VLLEKVTPDRARAVAQQIQRALNPLLVEWNGKTFAIGASLGVATITNGYDSTAAWMAAADAACYEAKRERGQVRFAPATALPVESGPERTPGQAAG
jgi:diguanylate cyclase